MNDDHKTIIIIIIGFLALFGGVLYATERDTGAKLNECQVMLKASLLK